MTDYRICAGTNLNRIVFQVRWWRCWSWIKDWSRSLTRVTCCCKLWILFYYKLTYVKPVECIPSPVKIYCLKVCRDIIECSSNWVWCAWRDKIFIWNDFNDFVKVCCVVLNTHHYALKSIVFCPTEAFRVHLNNISARFQRDYVTYEPSIARSVCNITVGWGKHLVVWCIQNFIKIIDYGVKFACS